MRSPLAYAARPGPLVDASAIAASVFLGSFAAVAFAFPSPVVIACAGFAVIVAGIAAGARPALAMSARWGLAMGAVFVAVNGIASQRGDTILIRGGELPVLGRMDISGEALVEGLVLALRVLVVMMAFAVHSATVDPDRLLRLMRPLARRSALTATLLTRLVPVAAGDYARLREAAALRGPAAAPVGRAALARRLVAGSLDRAVDAAATLELRGYALGAPSSAARDERSRHSWRFAAAGGLVIAGAVLARVAGLGGFEAYPTLAADLDGATLAYAAMLPLLAAAPFARLPARHGRD